LPLSTLDKRKRRIDSIFKSIRKISHQIDKLYAVYGENSELVETIILTEMKYTLDSLHHQNNVARRFL